MMLEGLSSRNTVGGKWSKIEPRAIVRLSGLALLEEPERDGVHIGVKRSDDREQSNLIVPCWVLVQGRPCPGYS